MKFTSLETIDLHQKSGQLLNSPRSLLALAQLGVEQPELHFKETKDFLLASKGDREAAQLRADHHETRRMEVLERLRERRKAIVAALEALEDPHAEDAVSQVSASKILPPGGLKLVMRNARSVSPRVSHRSPRSEVSGSDIDPHQSTYRSVTSMSQLSDGRSVKRSEKIEREIERMNAVMESNVMRQKQKLEYIEKLREALRKQDEKKEMRRREEENERALREMRRRKRDVELQVQRERKEQMAQAKYEEKLDERIKALEALDDRNLEREVLKEQKRQLHEVQLAQKREVVNARAQAIAEHSKQVLEDKRSQSESKMKHAEELRDKQIEAQERELAERKERNAKKSQENRMKRDRALNVFHSKLTGYIEKARNADEKREALQKDKQNYLLHRRMQDLEREKHRQKVKQEARLHEEQRRAEMLNRIEDGERHADEVRRQKELEHRRMMVQKELEIEDKREHVQHILKMQEYERMELNLRIEEKMEHVASVAAETEAIRAEKAEFRRKMLLQKVSVPHPSPGPADYASHNFANATLPQIAKAKFASSRPQTKATLDMTPGPGSYVNPIQAVRKNKGVRLKPKEVSVSQAIKSSGFAQTIKHGRSSSQHSHSGNPVNTVDAPPPDVLAEDYEDLEVPN